MRDAQVHLSIGSRFENIEIVQAVIDDSLKGLRFDEDARYWIVIAVREAVANAIKHGNRQDPEKHVEIQLVVDKTDVVIQIHDQGEGFDPAAVADPVEPRNLLKTDGRGIFYMKKFMDYIHYTFRPEGTVLTLRKRIAASQGSPAKKEEDEV